MTQKEPADFESRGSRFAKCHRWRQRILRRQEQKAVQGMYRDRGYRMEEMRRCRIKICGLSRPEDIAYVNEALPDYCGFIINFPKSHRNVTPDKVRSLVKGLDKRICPVGVFVDQPMETVLSLAADGTLGAVQLHGHEPQEYVVELKRRLKELAAAGHPIPVIQAFAVRTEEDIARARNSAADYILLDRGTGTGQTFDWSLVQEMGRPFFLAGGLGPDNLAEAVRELHPFAADMSSGVETEKIKDRGKILRAVNIIRSL